jgi:CBS domain-containing membrane protein
MNTRRKRFSLEDLKRRHHSAIVVGIFGFVSGGLAIGILAWTAHLAQSPLVFPSLGPTAFLLFYHPLQRPASPRNTLLGHLIGIAAAWLSLVVFGLTHAPPPPLGDITWARAGAATLSIAMTIGAMEFFDVPHPPAGATTMIVSLGLMPYLWQSGIILLAVIALLIFGWAINHLAGIPYPLWRPHHHPIN